MATGGSFSSCASRSPPVEEDPTFSHSNPYPEDMVGDGDRKGVSYILDSDDEHFNSLMEVFSEYIEKIVIQDKRKVYDNYLKIPKDLLEKHMSHQDIKEWFDDPEEDIDLGCDDPSYEESLRKAGRARDNYYGLEELSALFLNAPVNKYCPKSDTLNTVMTDEMCQNMTSEHTDELLAIAPDKQPGKKEFRVIKLKLDQKKRSAIFEDLPTQGAPMSEGDFLKENNWELVVQYVEDNTIRRLGWRSTETEEDLFEKIRKGAHDFVLTYDKDSSFGRMVIDDFIGRVGVLKKAKTDKLLTIVDVKNPTDVKEAIANFMTEHGAKAKVVLVLYNGHGQKVTGHLCLETGCMPQMTALDELYHHRDQEKGIPHAIDMVWGSCYSYKGMYQQKRDGRFQVIQLKLNDPHIWDYVPGQHSTIRSIHLTDECNEITCRKKKFVMGVPKRGDPASARNTSYRRLETALNDSDYGTQDAKQPFAISTQSTPDSRPTKLELDVMIQKINLD